MFVLASYAYGQSLSAQRWEKMMAYAERLRRENERLRRPCPTCQTPVKPALQGEHDQAYHSNIRVLITKH